MKKISLLTSILASTLIFYSCGGESTGSESNQSENVSAESETYNPIFGSFTDKRNNKEYKTVEVGNNVWMAENLDVAVFRNGDTIPEVKTLKEWKNMKGPAWCYYDNDEANGKTYGRIYNGYAITDPRGLAPEGWHIPNYQEMFEELGNEFGGNSYSGAAIRTAEAWGEQPSERDKSKYNVSGFNLLPGGYRDRSHNFSSIGSRCELAYLKGDGEFDVGTIIITTGDWHFTDDPERSFSNGRYVRCVKSK